MTHTQTNQQISTKKLFHVESWSVEQVTQWAKGTLTEEEANSGSTAAADQQRQAYLKHQFESKNVNGKKLHILDLSDLSEVLSEWPLGHRILVYKSIQDLLQFWHDLRADTFHSLLNHTHLKLKHLLKLLDDEEPSAGAPISSSSSTARLKTTSLSYPGSSPSRREFLKATSSFVTITYKKLINWLIRIPFIRIKRFELFRDELNAKMKLLLKIVRSKTKLTLVSGEEELRLVLKEMIGITSSMLNECELSAAAAAVSSTPNSSESNKQQQESSASAKLAVAFNHCVLEKIILKKHTPSQELGISLCSLVDGVFTVGEIARHSAADDCPHINVEDDLVAVNSQIVIGWDLSSITRLLEDEFTRNRHVIILLRKMPKDNYMTIKQYRQMEEVQLLTSNRAAANSSKIHLRTNDNKSECGGAGGGGEELEHQNQRKLSFSDIFIANENLEDDTSSDDNYNYEDDESDDVTTDDNLNSIGKQYDSSSLHNHHHHHYHCRNDSTKSDDNSLSLMINNENNTNNESSVNNNNNASNSDYDSEATRSVYRFYEKNKRGKRGSKETTTTTTNPMTTTMTSAGGDNLSAKITNPQTSSNMVNNMKHLKKNARKPFIRSMQNLFIRSRSNSIESLGNSNMSPNSTAATSNNNNESSSSVRNNFFGLKQGTPPPMPGSIIRSLFSNSKSKQQQQQQQQQQQGSVENLSSGSQSNPSTPNAIQPAPTSMMMTSSGGGGGGGSSSSSTSTLPVILSSKPPLASNTSNNPLQRGYKMSSQKPTIQGWLNKEKHVKHFQTRIAYTPHFKRYWCVLVKDYIAIYKHQEDKTPRDYLLLKDFFIKTSTPTTALDFNNNNNNKNMIKNFFIIGDKTKQLEHEFYADTSDDYHAWLSVLNDLRMKNLTGGSVGGGVSSSNSNSSSSLTFSLGNNGNNDDNSAAMTPSKTFKSTSNMPTILGSNEDMSVSSSHHNHHHQPGVNAVGSSANMKRNSIGSSSGNNNNNNHQSISSNWSRESSPGLVMAPVSRDSSPSFNYPYSQEREDTSESENELAQNPSLIKQKYQGSHHLRSNNSNDSLSSTSSLAKKISKSALISASVINPLTIKSCSPSPNSASSNCQFDYTDSEIARVAAQSRPSPQQTILTTTTGGGDTTHRCNSLPGSLQSCVGSYANETTSRVAPAPPVVPSNTPASSVTYSRLYSTPSSYNPTTAPSPVSPPPPPSSVVRSNPTNIPPRHSSSTSSNKPAANYSSQVKQYPPSVYNKNSSISSSPVASVVGQFKAYEIQQHPVSSSPKLIRNHLHSQQQQQQQPRKINMQIEASGGGILVTPMVAGNRLPPQSSSSSHVQSAAASYQQQQYPASQPPSSSQQQSGSSFMQASSSKVYRTELTILPTSPSTSSNQQVFNLSGNSSSQSSAAAVSSSMASPKPPYVVPSKPR